jgi:farnesyl diphosphate synthase
MTFEDKLGQWRLRIENYLQQYLQQQDSDCGNLAEAMRYGTLGGGKRLRAVLVYATAETIGLPADDVDSIAAAIEMIHAYSLIHDDLPAMDDDDLRRGQPTTHIQYGDATAILAGDALQAEAFAVLVSATAVQNKPETIAALVQRLALAAGQAGMVGGQQLDLDAEGQAVSLETLSRIHQLKTGALIRACCTMPAVLAGLPASEIARLDDYANNIGLAFQVHDDVLDITADTATLGKPQGADLERGKATYPALMGLDKASAKAASLRDEACAALSGFGDKAHWLEEIADFMVSRSH